MERRGFVIDIGIILIVTLIFFWFFVVKAGYLGSIGPSGQRATEGLVYTMMAFFALFGYAFDAIVLPFRRCKNNICYDMDVPDTPSWSKPIGYDILLGVFVLAIVFMGRVFTYVTSSSFVAEISTNVLLNGLKGIVENYFFIGFLGFTIFALIKPAKPNLSHYIVTSLIVAVISVLFHAGVGGLSFAYGSFIMIFFSFGTFITLYRDNLIAWNFAHAGINILNTATKGLFVF